MKLHVYKDAWYCYGAIDPDIFSGGYYDTANFSNEEYEYYQTCLDYQAGLQNLLERKHKEQSEQATKQEKEDNAQT